MKKHSFGRAAVCSSLAVFLAACGAPNYEQSAFHVTSEEVRASKPAASVPGLIKNTPSLPSLRATESTDTFDVVVTNVPVRDLLFALGRDAGVNMDVDTRVGGVVSISALDQTLEAILDRLADQVAIRVEYKNGFISVKPDDPYFKTYHINYANVTRTGSSSASTTGVGGSTGSSSISSNVDNSFWDSLESSITRILGTPIVGDQEGLSEALAAAGGGQALVLAQEGEQRLGGLESYFTLHRETGVLLVYAPSKLQEQVGDLLERVTNVASRQVLLEATIVEVALNNRYAQGIDWSIFNSLAQEGLAAYQGNALGAAAAAASLVFQDVTTSLELTDAAVDNIRNNHDVNGNGVVDQADLADWLGYDPRENVISFTLERSDTGAGGGTNTGYQLEVESRRINKAASGGGLAPRSPTDNFFTLAYNKGDLSAAVQLLSNFGDAKVLSSPRISTLNNQMALLKVVDQEVYFNVTVNEEVDEDTGNVEGRTYEVTENVVDVGFSMNVMPQINGDGRVILSLRPAVTRVIDYVVAPTTALPGQSTNSAVANRVPVTRVRELESIIAMRDGEVAVLGGLLEDRTTDTTTGVPGLSSLPGVGSLFSNKNQTTVKTEFVVFIRARVIKDPTLYGDYSDYRRLLPESDFIGRNRGDVLVPPEQKSAR